MEQHHLERLAQFIRRIQTEKYTWRPQQDFEPAMCLSIARFLCLRWRGSARFLSRAEASLGSSLEQPWYGKPVVGYADILTGVSNMYILALFNVFKPADECASFLEVHHHYQKYVGL